MTRFTILLLLFCSAAGAGPDLPAPRTLDGLGVCFHFTRGQERDLDLIAATGFRFIRTDLSWDATEKTRGRYDWSAYETLLAQLERRGLRALLILDYSNELYEPRIETIDPMTRQPKSEVASPQRSESIAAFVRWAAEAAAHFRGRRVVWEIWNEPNITFAKPSLDPRTYARLAIPTAKAIRAADPEATIIAPASSDIPLGYLEPMFEEGLLDVIDGVSVHPYRPGGPDGVLRDYRALSALIEKFVPVERRAIPVVCGEWGYSTYQGGGVAPATQADYAVRMQLINAWHGVPLTLWYDWRDDGTVPTEREHHFGLVDTRLRAKPAYAAMKLLASELGGFRLARRLPVGDNRVWVLLAVNPAGDQKLVVWSDGPERDVSLTLPSLADGPLAIDNGHDALLAICRGGTLSLSARSRPAYVRLPRPLPELSAAAAWRVTNAPTRVRAGQPEGVAFNLEIDNPFAATARVVIRLSGLEIPGRQPLELTLPPHGRMVQPIRGTQRQRATDGMATEIETRFEISEDGGGFRPLGGSVERLDVIVENPLTVQFAPLRDGVRAWLVNPAAEPVSGRLTHIGASRSTHPLPPGEQDPEIVLPRNAEGRVELHDEAGGFVIGAPIDRFAPVEFTGLATVIDGDAAIPATATIAPDRAAADAPASPTWRLDYSVGSGWRFIECRARDVDSSQEQRPEVPKAARALGLWLRGTGSGDALRARIIDETGQVFQLSGPVDAGSTWQWVTFDLTRLAVAEHWGGANDGVPHGRLELETLLLIDSARHSHQGTIHLSAPHWVFR